MIRVGMRICWVCCVALALEYSAIIGGPLCAKRFLGATLSRPARVVEVGALSVVHIDGVTVMVGVSGIRLAPSFGFTLNKSYGAMSLHLPSNWQGIPRTSTWSFAGFTISHGDYVPQGVCGTGLSDAALSRLTAPSPPSKYYRFVFPVWSVFVVVAIPVPVLIWRRWSRRRQPLRCAKCNYNLTGNVSGVCPECGLPIPQVQRARTECAEDNLKRE